MKNQIITAVVGVSIVSILAVGMFFMVPAFEKNIQKYSQQNRCDH